MPPTFTYPGVYIEEIPSAVHTITGVATSIAAFVGWAPAGPTSKATLVQSFSDFANQFGGLDSRSLLGYSVNQFFGNGGQQAYVVRLVAPGAKTGIIAVPASGGGAAFSVNAIDEGQWSMQYGVRIVQNPSDAARFSLLVVYMPTPNQETTIENFSNLSMLATDPQSRYVGSVINDPRTGSQIIQLTGISTTLGVQPVPNPLTTPGLPPSPYMLAGGDDGAVLTPNTPAFHTALNATGSGSGGVHLLDTVSIFNLLCVPGENDQATIQSLQGYCHDQRAFYIVDCNQSDSFGSLQTGPGNITGDNSINSAFYFPWVNAPDPLQQGRVRPFPPCGFVAGLYAATDATRGVWKAPAGIDASLTGESGLTSILTDLQNGTLNIRAINCLRNFPVYGDVIWGARTLRGNDQVGSEWKYVPIRRLALYLESSLYEGTQWVVFEPNDERLWSQIRLNVGVFMQGLFLQGAFQGTTPQKAYFVKCDAENNPQSGINMGIVNILVGFAPLFPAEFVVIQIQQMAGQLQA
ncbi:MAG: phage tail sheath family protein [Nitrospira sp. LK70]|nr:phage tail sheath family protein [Nitrospira sp. LK70]